MLPFIYLLQCFWTIIIEPTVQVEFNYSKRFKQMNDCGEYCNPVITQSQTDASRKMLIKLAFIITENVSDGTQTVWCVFFHRRFISSYVTTEQIKRCIATLIMICYLHSHTKSNIICMRLLDSTLSTALRITVVNHSPEMSINHYFGLISKRLSYY